MTHIGSYFQPLTRSVLQLSCSEYALVIPVINEGERIRNQLLSVQSLQLPVDVVIADGGSTDGSLDADFLATVGVRALLTKTGPGRLSSQLRMAYAWCIRNGYQGIVTVGGNGKDGVDAVVQMLEKLEQGYDYVQGSRYLAGGLAVVTAPWSVRLRTESFTLL